MPKKSCNLFFLVFLGALYAGCPLKSLNYIMLLLKKNGGFIKDTLYCLFHHQAMKMKITNQDIHRHTAGESKGVEDGRRPLALWKSHPLNNRKAVSGVARPQGVEG
jgi:hypothetical protein